MKKITLYLLSSILVVAPALPAVAQTPNDLYPVACPSLSISACNKEDDVSRNECVKELEKVHQQNPGCGYEVEIERRRALLRNSPDTPNTPAVCSAIFHAACNDDRIDHKSVRECLIVLEKRLSNEPGCNWEGLIKKKRALLNSPDGTVPNPDGSLTPNRPRTNQEGILKRLDSVRTQARENAEEARERAERAREEAKKRAQGIRDRAGDVRDNVTDRANDLREKGLDRVEHVRELNREKMEEYKARQQEARRKAQERRNEARRRYEEKREEAKKRMEEEREKRAERIKQIRDERKQEIVKRIAAGIEALNERFTKRLFGVLEKLEHALEKIDSRKKIAEQHGHNVEAVNSAIASAEAAIATAQAAIEDQAAKTYEIEIGDGDTSLRQFVSRARHALHDALTKLKELVKAAQNAVREAAKALKNIPKVNELKVKPEGTVENECNRLDCVFDCKDGQCLNNPNEHTCTLTEPACQDGSRIESSVDVYGCEQLTCVVDTISN